MNILLLTSNYPAPDLPKETTPVVHYFAKEWVSNGHKVIVIHNQTIFPRIIYPFLRLFAKILSTKVGYMFATKKIKDTSYEIEGVCVYRKCMTKLFPHFSYSQKVYTKQLNKITSILKEAQFTPDVIVAHWLTPQLKLLYLLKKYYPNIPNVLTIHEELPVLERDYGSKGDCYLTYVDKIAFRSERIRDIFINNHSISQNTFICYSGVPESYISIDNIRKIPPYIKTFTFTGTLIQRKHPECLIMALKDYKYNDFVINFIGEGKEMENLKALTSKYSLYDHVHFWGRIPREQVIRIMNETDCFIMVSKFETFGLVYLEAMAKGCITIASKNEGMDGIIRNGENGFLCEAGNWKDLKRTIDMINSLSSENKQKISDNARKTAVTLTDRKVAIHYLDFIRL